MKVESFRHICENATQEESKELTDKAIAAYERAREIDLSPCSPITLGIALNFSILRYENVRDSAGAI